MKVPNHIKQAICDCAEANKIARTNDEKIRNWLEQQGLVDEDFNNLNDAAIADNYIDSIDLTNQPLEFIEYLEKLN